MKLPDAAWRSDPALIAVVAALSDGEMQPRIVGGAVRDSLLGRAVHDIDLATPLRPEEVMRRLKAAGLKAVPTGIDHGTVTAVADGRTFEVTTLRRDVSTDGRRATVAFSDDWREDAARRDFTINALYADPQTGEISDYFGGLADLEAQRLRFIGDATQRIAEDHLRILRYFRFLARFGRSEVDGEAYAACHAAASSLKGLSRERIADELLKLLGLDDPRFAVRAMLGGGIFAPVLPEITDMALLDRLIEREQAHAVDPAALRRLLALLPASVETATDIGARLKLSRKQREAMRDRILCRDNSIPRHAAYAHGWDAARDAALLYADDAGCEAALDALMDWTPPRFPLKGADLIARGLQPGPELGRKLHAIEARWMAENFPVADRLDALVAEQL
ncbi:CCA tRNA nucleotidyltransferase [Novosphingopyxis baekryungensis]|uniref:CCA tRNA nucleotidyltransferase n=1 Tax=Novosphingopyxis baekryungensis TaxID=279369 RepID=UPI0003B38BD7|nr:CCA tRNA nucleotidyltransferase [Novosphingopyxis baekryungensis]